MLGVDSAIVFLEGTSAYHVLTPSITSTIKATPEISVQVFPNPTTDVLNIKTDLSNYSMRVFNIIGRPLQTLSGLNGDVQFDASTYPAGMYVLVLVGGGHGKKITKRFMKK